MRLTGPIAVMVSHDPCKISYSCYVCVNVLIIVRKTRSQLREELMKETKGDYDQLKTIHRQLRTQTRSGKSTSSDKRRLHACGDLLKKLQKRQVHQDDNEGEKDRQQQHGISMDNTRPYSSSKELPPVGTKQRAKSENTVMAKPDNSHHRDGGGAGGSQGGILSTSIPPLVASSIIQQHLPQHPILPQSSFPLGSLPRHGTSYPRPPPPPLSSSMPHPLHQPLIQQPPGVRPNNPLLGNYPQAGDSPLLATPPSPQQVYPSQPHGYR